MAFVVVLLFTAVVVLGWIAYAGLRDRRLAVRRIGESVNRLAAEAPRHDGSVAAALNALDRAVDDAVRAAATETSLRDRLVLTLNAIPQAVVVVDRDGAPLFNNEVADAFEAGRHGEAIVASAVGELLDESRRGVHANRTIDLYGPPRRTLVVTTTPLRRGGELIGAVAVVEDVSEARRIDSIRRDFVANISHELKTPIGAISLLAETLLAEDDTEILQRLAGRMVDEADRVNRTIDDLLVLSRIEHDEAPSLEAVPVHLVVAEAVERIRPAAEHRGITIDAADPSPRLSMLGERRQLVSALYNLLDNAVKYSDEGSVVEVRAGTDGWTVDIAVEDHGIGIPAKDLERVFERFYRVDQGRSRATGGTGLGLAIVRHVAANHHGDVRVDSRLGEGSTFTLFVPSASGPVALAPLAPLAPLADAG